MKKVYGLLIAALIISAAATAQPTPREKDIIHNDLARERERRRESVADMFRGEPEKARENARAANAYHAKAHRDLKQVHHNEVVRHQRYHPHYVRHHRHYYHHPYVHHRPAHAKVIVEVRH